MNKEREHRRIWNPEEDNILRTFVEESLSNGKPKWKEISEKLNEVLKLEFKRNPKQCRERWYNSLATNEKETTVWTLQDDVTLIQACKKYGHRWSRLTKEFDKSINDNKLKNHFYSTVRKIVRVINTIIKDAKKKYQTDLKTQNTDHYSVYDHYVLKEISKLRVFEPKLLSKVFSLIDSKQEYKYEAKESLEVESVKTINDEILDYMEDFVTETNQFTEKRILEMIVKVMHVNRTIKTKYTREIKLSLQDEEQIQKAHELKKKRDRKINNIVKSELENKIIPDKKTKAEVIKKIGDGNKILKRLIKPLSTRRIIRKKPSENPKHTQMIPEEAPPESAPLEEAPHKPNHEENFFQPLPFPFTFQASPPPGPTLQNSMNLSQHGSHHSHHSHRSTPESVPFESFFGFGHNQQFADLHGSGFIFNNNTKNQVNVNTNGNLGNKNINVNVNNQNVNINLNNPNLHHQHGMAMNSNSIQSNQYFVTGEREKYNKGFTTVKQDSIFSKMQNEENLEQNKNISNLGEINMNGSFHFVNQQQLPENKVEEGEYESVIALKLPPHENENMNMNMNSNGNQGSQDNPFHSNFLNEIPMLQPQNHRQREEPRHEMNLFGKELNPFFPQHKLSYSQGYFSFDHPIFPLQTPKMEQEPEATLYKSNPLFVIEGGHKEKEKDYEKYSNSGYCYSNSPQIDLANSSKFEGLFSSHDYNNSERQRMNRLRSERERSERESSREHSEKSRNHIFEILPNPFHPGFCPIFQENVFDSSRHYSGSEHGRIDMMESVPIGMVMGYGTSTGENAEPPLGEGMWKSCSFGGEDKSEKSKSKSGKREIGAFKEISKGLSRTKPKAKEDQEWSHRDN